MGVSSEGNFLPVKIQSNPTRYPILPSFALLLRQAGLAQGSNIFALLATDAIISPRGQCRFSQKGGEMKRQILVPLDSSAVGREVIHLADQWAHLFDAELVFMQVNPVLRDVADQDLLESVILSERVTAPYRAIASYGNPSQEIIEQEKVVDPWIVMMAAHSHSMMARILLGSNTDYVVNQCKSNLFVYKRSLEALKDLILVPVDYSKVNSKVIALADELGQKFGRRLHFVHVFSLPEFAHYNMEHGWQWDQIEIDRQHQEEEEKLNHFIAEQKVKTGYKTELRIGKPYEQVLAVQQKLNAKLIIMAAHEHTRVERFLVGSNTKYLLHHANCSVLVYKDR
ncbi:MAG: hypothetical protein A2527_07940 [Candidatus Lambdaproteobacteria bacterium RIFOXYD2_FULL_50_16]|uniref:UspA domain-containing protein n=1 Tax=Candidatus Lambdaproteobacteria bacterium RIFOXYD2_FULL_50_16 TaxID=1817772 RepID=A0A1F6GAF6_9PROT|nr:MAG: hypothetical protein A2527_07940 [Candidatus Lambdaproteobacteria bacterium RIFOXYD2_FULL_50_16]